MKFQQLYNHGFGAERERNGASIFFLQSGSGEVCRSAEQLNKLKINNFPRFKRSMATVLAVSANPSKYGAQFHYAEVLLVKSPVPTIHNKSRECDLSDNQFAV